MGKLIVRRKRKLILPDADHKPSLISESLLKGAAAYLFLPTAYGAYSYYAYSPVNRYAFEIILNYGAIGVPVSFIAICIPLAFLGKLMVTALTNGVRALRTRKIGSRNDGTPTITLRPDEYIVSDGPN
jgi:hypothetical protein